MVQSKPTVILLRASVTSGTGDDAGQRSVMSQKQKEETDEEVLHF